MFKSLNKPYPFNDDLKFNLKSILGISLGIFLFLLFFLPLNPKASEFDKKLLIITGFGFIMLILLFLFRITLPAVLPRWFGSEKWNIKKELFIHLLFLIFNTVAFSFYARYVGQISITFHAVVKIILISFIPIVTLVIINQYDFLKKRLENVLNQIKYTDVKSTEEEQESGIQFESETNSEGLFLFYEQIILIKAANNYIEIIFRQSEKVKRRLIRNTLGNAERMLKNYPSLIRVHRSYIVNVNSIRKIMKGSDGLKLLLYDYPQEISVSRQYTLKVKEALKVRE
ncbi:MAG: LytR/AlgR family response regulator transcription factor [Prolixibacteraceae bacterium]